MLLRIQLHHRSSLLLRLHLHLKREPAEYPLPRPVGEHAPLARLGDDPHDPPRPQTGLLPKLPRAAVQDARVLGVHRAAGGLPPEGHAVVRGALYDEHSVRHLAVAVFPILALGGENQCSGG